MEKSIACVFEVSQEIDKILEKFGKASAYFISPENPYSKQLLANDNEYRHNKFLAELDEMKVKYFDGFGTDENEKWPKEKSYLILSDDEILMNSLAKSFGQNAMLQIELGASVKLSLLF